MMKDHSKPLYSLTIEEYITLHREEILTELEDVLKRIENAKEKEHQQDIIFIDELCNLTGYKKSTVYTKVCRYEIPVVSRDKPLTFSRKEILNWLRLGKPSVIEMESDKY